MEDNRRNIYDNPSEQNSFEHLTAKPKNREKNIFFILISLCIGCHAGAEFTSASVESVASQGQIGRSPVGTNPPEDRGYFNIGVRPAQEDLGIGGDDLLGNSLSEVRLAQQVEFQQLLGENPPTFNPPFAPNQTVVADGAFKTPGLRNVELTAPYMHNGGFSTLEQVVDFYNRGGNFDSFPSLPVLNLNANEKAALVAFLQGLTDDRVLYRTHLKSITVRN